MPSSTSSSISLSVYQHQQQPHSPFNNESNIIPTNYSPRHLNESFETLQINQNEQNIPPPPPSTSSNRRSLSKFKSAPIQMLDFDRMEPSFGGDENSSISNNELEDLFFGSNQLQQQNLAKRDEKMISDSLDADLNGQNLIGDRSKNHLLPFKRSIKHQDLFCITPDTMVNLLNGDFDNNIDKMIIIDSRYPYEYDGGHIANAQNIYTKEKLLEELFVHKVNNKNNIIDCAYKTSSPSKRVVIIFHCEFSSERGPSLLRFLRNHDRALNEHSYPKLFYPELYLLEGGYKSFYEKHKIYCEPQEYKPMLHEKHMKDLKHFRSKAKSWEVQKHQLCASNIKLSASSMTIKHLSQKSFSLSTQQSLSSSSTSSSSSTLTTSSTMSKIE
jgi:rhodanese-related sulfurtransferase